MSTEPTGEIATVEDYANYIARIEAKYPPGWGRKAFIKQVAEAYPELAAEYARQPAPASPPANDRLSASGPSASEITSVDDYARRVAEIEAEYPNAKAKARKHKLDDLAAGYPQLAAEFDAIAAMIYPYVRDGRYFCRVAEKKRIPICNAFTPIGRTRDESGAGHGVVIAFSVLGQRVETTIDFGALQSSPAAVRETLASLGLWISPKERTHVDDLLSRLNPRHMILTVHRPGWRQGRYVTVLGEVVSPALGQGESIRLSDRARAEDCEKRGTLEAWKLAANDLASKNDHWAIALAASFAGPVVDLCGLDTCAACISGPTSDGKTIALTIPASAHGNPRERAATFHPLRTTANALESLFERASGATISLDEIALADPREVGGMLMLLASGTGKARSNRANSLARMARWRAFVLFSSERNLKAVITGAGGKFLGGMAVRAVDVATTGARKHDPAEIRRLGVALRQNYGHAAPAFAAHAISRGYGDDPAPLRAAISKAAAAFAGAGASPAVDRAAQVFGILSVAGDLAAEAGLISDLAGLQAALKRAWARFAGSEEIKATDPTRAALEALAENLVSRRNETVLHVSALREPETGDGLAGTKWEHLGAAADAETPPPRQSKQADGYYDVDTYYVRKSRLHALADGIGTEADLKAGLAAAGALRRRGAKHLTWEVLPGGLKVTHYRIRADFVKGTPESGD